MTIQQFLCDDGQLYSYIGFHEYYTLLSIITVVCYPHGIADHKLHILNIHCNMTCFIQALKSHGLSWYTEQQHAAVCNLC